MEPRDAVFATLTTALVVLGLVFAATPALPASLEVTGSGTAETNCLATLEPGCTGTATGQATGTPITEGTFVFRFDTGSPASLNGYPFGGAAGAPQGVCLPASSSGRLTVAASGDTIDFNHAGTVCEEATPGSPYLYHGTYRITGGTGVFSTAGGGGSVTATFSRDSTSGDSHVVFFNLHGSY